MHRRLILFGAAMIALSFADLAIADDWSSDGFVKFWKTQFGKTAGVVGIVALVGAGATLIILSKGRG